MSSGEKTGSVIVEIHDQSGNLISSFDAEDNKSFVQMGQDNSVDMPVSCCSGACFVCACKVKSGLDDIDIGKLSIPLIDTDDDQILSCVAGIKSSCFADGKDHKIILEKLL